METPRDMLNEVAVSTPIKMEYPDGCIPALIELLAVFGEDVPDN